MIQINRSRIAFWSPNLSGIHAALSAGLGLSLLPQGAVLPEQKITETTLVAAANASPAVLRIAESLVEFCAPRGAGKPRTQPGKQRLAVKA